MGYFENECSDEGCEGPAMDNGKCQAHGGRNYDNNGAPENNNNAQTHALHMSAETFLEHADQHHVDTYYAVHESLCRRFEQAHGREPMYHDKQELAEVALDMAKLNMATEYQKEHAINEKIPLTEHRKRMTEAGPWEREEVSKVEQLMNHIRRENRLLLKDKGIYASPESQQAEATESLVDALKSE